MRLRLPLAAALVLPLLASAPLAAQPDAMVSWPNPAQRDSILAALIPTIPPELSESPELRDVRLVVRDGWAFVRAIPYSDPWQRADKYPDLRLGCDCDPFLYALLLRSPGGGWRVVDSAVRVRPGAVPYERWAARHGAPAALFQRDPDEVALEAAMREYIDAFALNQPARLLALLAPGRALRRVDGSVAPPDTSWIPYDKLAGDLRARRGWYRDLFVKAGYPGPKEFYSFYPDHFRQSGGRAMWRRTGPATFVSPWRIRDGFPDVPYVRWTREGGRWVVDELGFPTG